MDISDEPQLCQCANISEAPRLLGDTEGVLAGAGSYSLGLSRLFLPHPPLLRGHPLLRCPGVSVSCPCLPALGLPSG